MMTMTDGELAVFLNAYEWRGPWRAEKEESGMNNTTMMIYAANERYVLRIYDNHQDEGVVQVEHQVLQALARSDMPIQVPKPVANKQGLTVSTAPDGKLAALYHYIEGHRPTVDNLHHVAGLGQAAGSVAKVLQHVTIQADPLYDPYYRCETTHAAMAADVLKALCRTHALTEGQLAGVETMLTHRARLAKLTPQIEKLPHQWIHGDIVFTNSVAQGDRVVGLLDFEFTTVDVRVMEVAVVLAEFPSEDSQLALQRIDTFCSGYGSQMRLTREELELLPALIKLRMMDVFLHFAGRLSEGLDDAHVWAHQIERNSYVCEWVDRYADELSGIFARRLGA
ncbi:homoserine kinase type II [Paenibacillus phyllosphaerae]|uniref:Homoserine kinase type II n=1 Tax=Paenibacillus phyllosphaerae TaxID=274593 RepID=A0A7W5AY63_9BACL|nr:phosphotransferase [Paenibacillus phyllosphaerae]MBB3110316.1 homoserine kinase type II [Paenibacillus phyllosphaerae]